MVMVTSNTLFVAKCKEIVNWLLVMEIRSRALEGSAGCRRSSWYVCWCSWCAVKIILFLTTQLHWLRRRRMKVCHLLFRNVVRWRTRPLPTLVHLWLPGLIDTVLISRCPQLYERLIHLPLGCIGEADISFDMIL